jgi:NAD(P)-dependent dehydrogenase (short-subunit alcohol dehydrogenase family)
MTDSNNDRAILITGAGKRVGAGLARALGEDGWFVHVHHNASADEAAEVVSEIERRGGRARAVQADLAEPSAPEGLIADCAGNGPALVALINNASLFAADSLSGIAPEQWDRHMAVNLRAPAFLARAFARQLPEGETGCIINMLDNKVFGLNPDYFSYTASKFGLLGVTRTLAMALAPKVRVCGIAPGITLISGDQTQAEFERAHANNLLRRGCTIDDIVNAARMILSTPSMTGRSIVLDGGQSLSRAPRDVAFL